MAMQEVATQQGDLALLDDPVAQKLLHSTNVAHLAYTWHDGTPRVVPIWFEWNGHEIILASPPKAPKLSVLPEHPQVSLEIDSSEWPYKVLIIRGTAKVEMIEGVVPEYAVAAERFFGIEQGHAWTEQVGVMFPQMARISIHPEWVCILDFETRFPSAFS